MTVGGQVRAALEHIRSAIKILFRPGDIVELRIPGLYGTQSGYFDDHEKLAKAIAPAITAARRAFTSL